MRPRLLVALVAISAACSNQPVGSEGHDIPDAPAPGLYELVAIDGALLPQAFPYLPDCPATAVRGDLELKAGGYSIIYIAGTHLPRICAPETQPADSVFGTWGAFYSFDEDSIHFHMENITIGGVPLPDWDFRGSFDDKVIQVVVPPNAVYFSKDLILFPKDSFVATFKRH